MDLNNPDVHRYTVLPAGVVTGGWAYYLLDPKSARITFDVAIKAFGHPIEGAGGFDLPALSVLLSNRVRVGYQVEVLGVSVRVLKMHPDKKASLSFSVPELKLTGTAIICLSNEYVELLSLNGLGTVYGFKLPLNIVRIK